MSQKKIKIERKIKSMSNSSEYKKVKNYLKVDFKILIQKAYVKSSSLASVHGLPKIFKKNRVSLKIIWITFAIL